MKDTQRKIYSIVDSKVGYCRMRSEKIYSTDPYSLHRTPTPASTPFCQSLISLMVSVDVKHRVYLLTEQDFRL